MMNIKKLAAKLAYLLKFKGMSKKVFLIAIITLLLISSTLSYFFYVNRSEMLANAQTKSQSIESVLSSSGCNSKAKLSELYNIPDKEELRNLVSITEFQKIYNDYKSFLEGGGYAEYVNSAFCGYFKKPPINKKSIRHTDRNLGFSYTADLQIRKPYILIVPFINTANANKIAGIVFVYSQQRVEAFIVEENNIKNQNKASINIFVKNSTGQIVNAKDVKTESVFIDWQCFRSCMPGCISDCIAFPPGANALCFSICWGICYDMCTLSKP